jgi:dTDP-4-amino-4,6-dideoxygalactose transaminase
MIPFNIPCFIGSERKYFGKVVGKLKFSGDGEFTYKCNKILESILKCQKALLTTSGTHALEAAAILADIEPGDEVIMPSFTFVSTANAFVLRGARIIFVDIRPDTMNIDEKLIERAISKKTKAIVVVHYGGVSCEMDEIMKIAEKHKLFVIEDAAQAIMSKYKNKFLGTIGDIGCISFHETKNITCGEGGALILNRKDLIERAEIIREKGTDRSRFLRGEVDKYTWVDIGSSYLPSELNAAFLYPQLLRAKKITSSRLKLWNLYYKNLVSLENAGFIGLARIPSNCSSNGHIFFLKAKDIKERTKLIGFLEKNGIMAVFHYIPLHSSTEGKRRGYFKGKDIFTTKESERILRLPMYYKLKSSQVNFISKKIRGFYLNKNK